MKQMLNDWVASECTDEKFLFQLKTNILAFPMAMVSSLALHLQLQDGIQLKLCLPSDCLACLIQLSHCHMWEINIICIDTRTLEFWCENRLQGMPVSPCYCSAIVVNTVDVNWIDWVESNFLGSWVLSYKCVQIVVDPTAWYVNWCYKYALGTTRSIVIEANWELVTDMLLAIDTFLFDCWYLWNGSTSNCADGKTHPLFSNWEGHHWIC